MTRLITLILGAALGCALGPIIPVARLPALGVAHAEWVRVELAAPTKIGDQIWPAGTEVCKDKETGTLYPPSPYTDKKRASQATPVCTAMLPLLTWLGTAQAQVIANKFVRGQFDSNINVGTPPTPPPPGLSAPWLQTDIGSPPAAGSAFDAQNALTLSGSGDFHKDTSAYHFVYQGKTGNWRIDFNLTSLTGAGQYRDCGPAIIDSLGADVKYAYLSPSLATGKAHFGGRPTTGAGVYEDQTYSAANFSSGPMRIEIIGSTITGYISTDGGMTYTQVGSTSWTPSGTFDIGVHVDSGESAALATCIGSVPVLTSLSSSTAGVLNFVPTGGGTAADSSIGENAGTFSGPCVARSVDTSGAITVPIQNAGTGSAVAGTDFTNPPYPQTLSWANGEGGTKCGSVAIINRAGGQPSRTINYSLGSPTGGATLGTQTTHTLTITDSNLVAMKTQPGVYALFNKQCIPVSGQYGCSKAEILNTIATEICPNSYLVGMKMIVQTTFLVSNTPGVYTSTGPDLGFAIFDPVLDALAACGKFLMLQGETTFQVDVAEATALAFPTWTYPSSWNSDGTAAPGTYGLVWDTQSSQPGGMNAQAWHDDWRDLGVAINTAYCARYGPGGVHQSSAFYGMGAIYWNTSLPLNAPYPPGYDEATFNNKYREYLASSRAACPTINLMTVLDYANPFPAQMSSHLIAMRDTNHASMGNNDTVLPINGGGDGSWGQQVYSGNAGSPTVIDFRGVVRQIDEVESPEMCGNISQTPAQVYDLWANGSGSYRARRPSHIVVTMATECDAVGTGWQAWKAYLSGLGGATVFIPNGDATRHTPAYVKANFCESSLTCQ